MAKGPTTWNKKTAPRKGGKKGRKRKATIFTENVTLLAAKNLMTPLEVLQGYACNQETNDALRITAATAAAKYVHQAQPMAVQLSGDIRLRRTFADAVQNDTKSLFEEES